VFAKRPIASDNDVNLHQLADSDKPAVSRRRKLASHFVTIPGVSGYRMIAGLERSSTHNPVDRQGNLAVPMKRRRRISV